MKVNGNALKLGVVSSQPAQPTQAASAAPVTVSATPW